MKRNSFVYVFKAFQLAFMAIIAMTIFLRTEMHRDSVTDGGIYSGALFFAVIVLMFNGMAELTMTVSRLPVFYKQRDFLFFPSWAYALPSWILKIPLTLMEVGVWVFLTYYAIGFDPNIGRLFRQFLILALVNQMAYGLFRFIAAIGRDMTVALTLGSFLLAILFAMGGFVLSKDDIKKWWIWGFWISPLMYGQNAMVNNEFLGNKWNKMLPGPSEEPLGVQVLRSRGFFTESYWYWIGVGALAGYTLLFNLGYIISLIYLNPLEKDQAVKSEQSPGTEQDNGSGGTSLLKDRKTCSDRHSTRVGDDQFTSEEAGVETNHNRKRGMVLPFEPYSISFDEVTYSVDMPQGMKSRGVVEDRLVLLKGVGVTGAGKTTLMDVLAGRKTGGYVGGNTTISGYPKKQETFARISGYYVH